MKGILVFILATLIILALSMLLGACCIGTFLAPVLWMKVVCFVITNIFVVAVTVVLCAVVMNIKEPKQ